MRTFKDQVNKYICMYVCIHEHIQSLVLDADSGFLNIMGAVLLWYRRKQGGMPWHMMMGKYSKINVDNSWLRKLAYLYFSAKELLVDFLVAGL